MKLFRSLLIVPLLVSPWAAANTPTDCHADNCLRALRNPTRTAAATSFCQSYTTAVITATTSLPTQFAEACGSGPTQSSRLSSACSCYVSAAPSACGDTTSDNNNCGACGNVCDGGSTCSSGTCICTNSGKAPCNGQCPDLTSDNNNCGSCGHSCASGTTCQTGSCIPVPGPATCTTNYTASCSDVVNGILASNSIASPDLVDYRIQSARLGITSPAEFLAALGPDPCSTYTDPSEHDICLELLSNSEFVAQLTDIMTEVLGGVQTCASDFAAGAPDQQIIIHDNATCTGGSLRRRVGEEYDLTQDMLEAMELYRMTAPEPALGPQKAASSDLLQLIRKQASTCSQTGTCFERCPDCRNRETYCGTGATVLTTAVCAAVGAVTNAAVAVLAGTVCGTACAAIAPLAAPACAQFCARAAGGLSNVAVLTTCAVVRNAICNPMTERCANCNSANNGICAAGSTQCCPGETGTRCGADCCCCPVCQAPGGINCACTAAPC